MSIIKKILFTIFVLVVFPVTFAHSEELKKLGKFKDWEAIMIINDSSKVCFAQSKPVLQSPKKNEREARFAVADQDSTVGKLSELIQNASKWKNLILKLGDRAVFCSNLHSKEKSTYFSVDSFANKILDPIGAGDALLAYSTLSMLASKSLVTSSIIGSIAAACECEIDGNVPINPQNIIDKINNLEKQINY